MTILLINHYAGSPELGMEYRPYYFAREWIKSGQNVIIVSASFSHVRIQQPEVKQKHKIEKIDNIIYHWIKTKSYKRNNIKRVFNIISFVLKILFKVKYFTSKYNPDIVIASSTYPMDIFPAYMISRKSGAKLIFEVHDLWPLSPIEIGGYSKWHPYIIFMQIAENFAYKKSDRVVSILPETKEYMIKHGLDPHKFNYIPNGIDINEWDNKITVSEEHKKTLQSFKMNNQTIIGYIGSIGIANALDNFIEAALKLKNDNIVFIIVGQGPEKKRLVEKVQSLNITNVLFLPPVPKSAIPDLLSYFDMLYIGLKNQKLFQLGICPNKLIDYMMAAKPIIHAIETGNNLIEEIGCGINVEPENTNKLAEAIINLNENTHEEKNKMGVKGRNYARKIHNVESLSNKFLEIMKI